MASALEARITPARRVTGQVRVPGDKSISHRYALLGALAAGTTRITNYSPGADCSSTLECLVALACVHVQPGPARPALRSHGDHRRPWARAGSVRPRASSMPGTPARRRGCWPACWPRTRSRRPSPATTRCAGGRCGASSSRCRAWAPASSRPNGRLPLTIIGSALSPIDFTPAVPSAQVKSAVLLAGLQTRGRTVVHETVPTRDHTELALAAFGAALDRVGRRRIAIRGGQPLAAIQAAVPGDPSSATFWAVAAASLPGSDVEILDLGLNPSRTALLDVLARAGARVEQTVDAIEHGEPRGRVRIRHGGLQAADPRPRRGARRSSTRCPPWPRWPLPAASSP